MTPFGAILMNTNQFRALLHCSAVGLLVAAGASKVLAQNFLPPDWGRQFGSTGSDTGYGIAADGLGNVYITGQIAADAFLRKFDAAGNPLWGRTLATGAEDYGYGVTTDGSGNVYVTGAYGAPTDESRDAYLSKYSASGTQLWTRQFGTTGPDFGNSVAADLFGNIYVTGGTGGSLGGTSAGNDDVFLRKYDSDGIALWTRQTGVDQNDYGKGVSVDAAGNIYLAGNYSTNYGFVSKYDPGGNQLWSTTLYDATITRTTRGIAADGSGNIYVTGSSPPGGNAMLTKLDSNGNEQWLRTIVNTGADDSRGVTVDAAGNVYIAGLLQENGPTDFSQDAFVAKYTPTGTLLWSKSWGTSTVEGFPNEGFWGVSSDTLGNVFVGGFSGGALGGPPVGASDVVLARIPGPRAYAVVIGSRAPAWDNNDVEIPDGIRGDIDATRVADKLDDWAEVHHFDFNYSADSGVANVISQTVSEIAGRVTRNDVLFFYYSGHADGGVGNGVDESLAPTANDPPYTDDMLGDVLSDPRLADVTKVVLLDGCATGGFLTPDGLPSESPLIDLPKLGLFVAAAEDGAAFADPATGQGYWTDAILDVLERYDSLANLARQIEDAYPDEETITGWLKARGHGSGEWEPMSYFSQDLDPRLRLDGTLPQVPEPSTFVLFCLCFAIKIPRRCITSGATPGGS
jgi:hypothetical protein